MAADRDQRGPRAVVYFQLSVDSANVIAHRALGQMPFLGNISIAETGRQELQHREFAFSETVGNLGGRLGRLIDGLFD